MSEDSTLYWMLVAIGSVPVGVAIARHAVWGVQPTLGGILVSIAVWGLSGVVLQRHRQRHGRRAPRSDRV